MSQQVLAPDAILLQTNLVGAVTAIDEPVDSPDGSWLTASSATAASILRVSFPTPTDALRTGAGLQRFRIWVRKLNFSGTPTATIELWQNGVLTSTLLAATNVTSTTGQLLQATWDASGVTAANVELRITGTVGGTGGNRSTVEVGAVEWVAEDINVNVTPPTLAGVAAIPTPTTITEIHATATPATAAGAASIATPTTVAETRAFPATIQGGVSFGAPSVSTGQRANPATVQGAASIPAPQVSAGQRANPATISRSVSFGTPTVAAETRAFPATISRAVSIPTPPVSTGQRANPATLAGQVSVPAPAVLTTTIMNPGTINGSVSFGAPVVRAGAGAFPPTIAARALVPAPMTTTTVVVSPASIQRAVVIPAPTVKTPKLIAVALEGWVVIPTPMVDADIRLPATSITSMYLPPSNTKARPWLNGATLVVVQPSTTDALVEV